MATTSSSTKKTETPEEKDGKEKANIPAATSFSPSGAPNQTSDIPVDHPAVDNDPRKDTSALQNRADYNDPSLSSAEAVAENLRKQGMDVKEPEGSEKSKD